jgi:hypothetical protein
MTVLSNTGWPNWPGERISPGSKPLVSERRESLNIPMTEEEEKIIAALENAQATPQQQKEAARIIRDLNRELRELSEWEQRD